MNKILLIILAIVMCSCEAKVQIQSKNEQVVEYKIAWDVSIVEKVVIINAYLANDVHVYVDGFNIEPVPNGGVGNILFDKPEISNYIPWIDPDLPDDPPQNVWSNKITIKIPFSKPDIKSIVIIGATITYRYCDNQNCYSLTRTTIMATDIL